ncbi:hypothetical protein [Aliamphritea spongicola]|nr:hypothetical protein [Aliamphritea spongicola]
MGWLLCEALTDTCRIVTGVALSTVSARASSCVVRGEPALLAEF